MRIRRAGRPVRKMVISCVPIGELCPRSCRFWREFWMRRCLRCAVGRGCVSASLSAFADLIGEPISHPFHLAERAGDGPTVEGSAIHKVGRSGGSVGAGKEESV